MNSLPLISHRLFAAAIRDDYGLRSPPQSPRPGRPNADPAVIHLEPVPDAMPPRGPADPKPWTSLSRATNS